MPRPATNRLPSFLARASAAVVPALAILAGAALLWTLSAACRWSSRPAPVREIPGFAEIEALAVEAMRRGAIPELGIAIVRGDRTVYENLLTTADADESRLNRGFAIGSLGKAFTATATLALFRENGLSLDTPVAELLPWFSRPDEPRLGAITVRHLLQQTSGLSGEDDRIVLVPEPGETLESVARKAASLSPVDDPGRGMRYTSWNYLLLGALIEAESGQSYEEYLATRVLAPLGMTSTGAGGSAVHAQAFDETSQWWFGFPVPSRDDPRPALASAGYLSSTVADMALWLRANLSPYSGATNEVLPPELWEAMHRPPDGAGGSYAMGWGIRELEGRRLLSHEGLTPCSFSAIAMDPESGWGIALLSATASLYAPKELSPLADAIMSRLLGLPIPEATDGFARWTAACCGFLGLLALLSFLHARSLIRGLKPSAPGSAPPPSPLATLLHAAGDLAFPVVALVVVPSGSGFPFWPAMLRWQPDLAIATLAFAVLLALSAPLRLVPAIRTALVSRKRGAPGDLL